MGSTTGLLEIEIDGVKTNVPQGATILEAAKELGISIPTLCHHEVLSAYGACRVCLVEVSQSKKTELKTSCNNVVQQGMSISTNAEAVTKARIVIIELLLARCPDSEQILEIAGQLGVEKTRFHQRQDQRCILCGLCVRMCEERMGKSAINFAHRGIDRAVTVPFDQKTQACQTCGACVTICPTNCVNLDDVSVNEPRPIAFDFQAGLSSRSPVYVASPHAVPKVATIDKEHCVHLQNGDCRICKDVCEVGAIDFEQLEEKVDVQIGSVIVTPGFETFAITNRPELCAGDFPNVLTTMQFERMLSAAGPYGGHVVRPSDGEPVRRIAWIQCVGSRDSRCENEYCSSVCCMAATKQALVADDHVEGLDATIFYIDIRAHGKDFDQYYQRAESKDNIHYVKAMPSPIVEVPGTNDLQLHFVDQDGQVQQRQLDLVVLAVGIEPCHGIKDTASVLGIDLNKFGFCATDRLSPLSTSRAGVFVAGAFQEPKDIPETVMQASGAASMAMELLAPARNTLVTRRSYPAEHDVTDEEPRIGVFVCHCGMNIGSVVDVEHVTESIKTQPGVIMATHTTHNVHMFGYEPDEHQGHDT
jgi:heterodisulfide reductase subunit A